MLCTVVAGPPVPAAGAAEAAEAPAEGVGAGAGTGATGTTRCGVAEGPGSGRVVFWTAGGGAVGTRLFSSTIGAAFARCEAAGEGKVAGPADPEAEVVVVLDVEVVVVVAADGVTTTGAWARRELAATGCTV
jgi:hypothetical protein